MRFYQQQQSDLRQTEHEIEVENGMELELVLVPDTRIPYFALEHY